MKIAFLIVLIFSCIPRFAQTTNDSFSYDYRETIKTILEVREVHHKFSISPGCCLYIHKEKILGSKKATTMRKEYMCQTDVPVEMRKAFFKDLVEAGIFDLKTHKCKSWCPCLSIKGSISGHELPQLEFASAPDSAQALKVRECVFSMISRLGLDGTCENKKYHQRGEALMKRLDETLDGDLEPANNVTIFDIILNLKKYNGKRVSFVGYYHSGQYCKAIFSNEKLNVEESLWVNAPSVYFPDAKAVKYNDRWIKIEGTVDGHRGGYLGGWQITLDRITSVVAAKRPY